MECRLKQRKVSFLVFFIAGVKMKCMVKGCESGKWFEDPYFCLKHRHEWNYYCEVQYLDRPMTKKEIRIHFHWFKDNIMKQVM